MNTEQYPNCLKIGKVIPLYKSGSRSEPGNFRPIILLPGINKIYEKLLFNRLTNFFEKNHIIKDNQHGFRTGHSTEMAISKFYEDTLRTLDKNQSCAAIFLDLSKAFDSVNREILLRKLYIYGIRGPTYNLLKSYLTNRIQYIQIGNIKSDPTSSDIGVPQGSMISTLLFLIIINDLGNSTDMTVLNFADDTLLYHPIQQNKEAETWLNKEFGKVNIWITKNQLKLNYSKTNHIIFSHNSNKTQNINLASNTNIKIKQTKSCKYLGMIIDNKLNWNLHIDKITKQISKSLGILFRVRYYLNKPSLKLIFHTLLMSHLKYGILNYARANKTALNPLNILLNRALRCLNFLGRRDKKMSKIYFEERILKIEDNFKLELGKFCFKYNNNLLPNAFNEIFTNISAVHQYNTRNHDNRLFRNKQKKLLDTPRYNIWAQNYGIIYQ